VHILFLQLIIDPACSVVFEAEPLEAGAMRAEPRHPDAGLFDAGVLARGLWQGGGLLLMLLAVYAGTREFAGSDEMARALTFAVLVLANLALIYVNRSWVGASWRAAGVSRSFEWISLATIVLLGCVLGIPAVSSLFAFAQPTPALLLAGAGVAVSCLLWFEAVKWGLGGKAGQEKAA